jgi:hypothetical protein
MNPIEHSKEQGQPKVGLPDIIDAYIAETEEYNHDTLLAWVRRYPEYSQELTDFAAEWSLVRNVPTDRYALSEEEVAEQVERYMPAIRELIARYAVAPAAVAGAQLAGLVSAGQAQGMSTKQLAAQTGLSVPLLTKLDRRLVKFASIPGEIVTALAAALNREVTSVAQYLQGNALLAPTASYKADEAPRVPEQGDFFAEVSKDKVLTPEQRARLMALKK